LPSRQHLSAGLTARLGDFTSLMARQVADARQALLAVVVGRLDLHPPSDAESWRVCGMITLLPLAAGLPQNLASPTGVVPEWTREVPGEVRAA
jgi:hypothetical protein